MKSVLTSEEEEVLRWGFGRRVTQERIEVVSFNGREMEVG